MTSDTTIYGEKRIRKPIPSEKPFYTCAMIAVIILEIALFCAK